MAFTETQTRDDHGLGCGSVRESKECIFEIEFREIANASD